MNSLFKKILFVILGLLFLNLSIGCEKNLIREEKSDELIQDYIRSVDEALNILNDYKSPDTKSMMSKNIKEILVIGSPNSAITKSSTQCDTLLYVVNYEDDGGYIVLSADRRVPERMLMMTDTGNVSAVDFTVDGNTNNNPFDTLNIYDEENDEYLIGGSPYGVEQYILNEIQAYASMHTSGNGDRGYVTDLTGTVYAWDGINCELFAKSWAKPVNYYQDTIARIEPMLVTRWSQRNPYNDKVPNGRYTGCVVNAIAQIMAYEKYPENYHIGGLLIDWDALTKNHILRTGLLKQI